MKKEETTHRIVKTGTCPTLSGKSTLTYHIGCDEKSEMLLRISGNTGTGFFNRDWTPLEALIETLEQAPQPLTFWSLHPLFEGKSANTPAFLLAALKSEGLVNKQGRGYELADAGEFRARMKALVTQQVKQVKDEKSSAEVVEKPKPHRKFSSVVEVR